MLQFGAMTFILAAAFFLIAALYAAVGSGGGSGYLAVMSLANVTPDVMRPTALALNVLITGISTWKFSRAGHFSGRIFWPIASVSIPFAFLGGRIDLPDVVYRPLVGVVLLYSAWRLFRSSNSFDLAGERPLPLMPVLLAGAGIGLASGLMGIGGGIFLSPLLLLTGWADTRKALGVTAAFVLVNSVAGLLGYLSQARSLPSEIPFWALTAVVGGWIGAEFGSKRLSPALLRRLLALVLVIGGGRFMMG
jgi:uncharacterized membrane protein YfcA